MLDNFLQILDHSLLPAKKKPIIQSFWIGRDLSVIERLVISSWLRYKYEFHLYAYEEIKDLPEGTVLKDAREIVPEELIFKYQNGSYAAFSNLFRYALLYQKGNVWTDLDIVCVNPSYLEEKYIICSEEDRFGNVFPATFFLKAPQGSEAMKFAYEQTLDMREKVLSGEIKWQIGRTTINQILEKFDLAKYIAPPKHFTINDWEHVQSFLDPNYVDEHYPSKIEEIPKETIAIHLWHEVFRRENIDISKEYPKDSIFEALKTKFLTPRNTDITVVITTKNSSQYIGKTLNYLSQHFANIVVGIDSKSDRQTWDEVQKYDCTVVKIRNARVASGTSKQLLPHCKNNWVLSLHDREMPSEKAINQLKGKSDFTLADLSDLGELFGKLKKS